MSNTSLQQAEIDSKTDDQQQNQDRDVVISNSASTQILCDNAEQEPVLSRRRWFVLFAISIFGLSLQLTNDTSAILKQMLKLLDLNVDSYVYINQIFNYLLAFLAAPSAVFLDKYGIRATIYAGVCFFALKAIFESLLYFTQLPGWHHNKMYFYIASRIVSSINFALFYILPLKVSESWFSESERSTAWTIMFLQLEIGDCITSYIYPRQINNTEDFRLLAYINIASATIVLVSCIACVRKSEPNIPPSERAASQDITPFMISIKRIFKHRGILLHQIHAAIGMASGISVRSLVQDIFSSIGYSQIFAANYLLINSAILIVMTIFMASFVHKVSNTTLACKVGSFIQSFQFVLLLIAILCSFPGWSLIAISIILTCCKSWTVPYFNDMTAQLASGVVSKPTIVGFSILITPLIMTLIQVTFASLIEIHDKTNDYHKSLIFLIAVCITNESIYQMFFYGKTISNDFTPDNEQQDETESHQE